MLETFGRDQLVRFLTAVDGEFAAPARIVLIGGSAAALGHGLESVTKDIDTWHDVSLFEKAFSAARRATGLAIPVGCPGVQDAPYEFEARLQRVLPALSRLEVWVLEAHDLCLSKMLRGHAGDLAAIEQIHARRGLSFETLLERYLGEMDHVIGHRPTLNSKLIACLDLLFGELKAEEARRRLRASPA